MRTQRYTSQPAARKLEQLHAPNVLASTALNTTMTQQIYVRYTEGIQNIGTEYIHDMEYIHMPCMMHCMLRNILSRYIRQHMKRNVDNEQIYTQIYMYIYLYIIHMHMYRNTRALDQLLPLSYSHQQPRSHPGRRSCAIIGAPLALAAFGARRLQGCCDSSAAAGLRPTPYKGACGLPLKRV